MTAAFLASLLRVFFAFMTPPPFSRGRLLGNVFLVDAAGFVAVFAAQRFFKAATFTFRNELPFGKARVYCEF